jgi:curved DNA-binding protein CbpA
MKDPYEILGVQRTADEAAIRAAYRKLAKKHHPDVNPDKPDAAARFGEISAAYDLLSDKEKRAKFDRGEIDAEGHEVPASRRLQPGRPGSILLPGIRPGGPPFRLGCDRASPARPRHAVLIDGQFH